MNSGEAFGPLLQRMRMAKHLSLGEMARQTHYSKGYLSKVEAGLRPPSEGLARQCDAVLGADGAVITAARKHLGSTSFRRADTGDDEEGRWVLQMDDDGSVWFQPVGRRSVLALSAASLLALQAGGCASLAQAGRASTLQTFTDVFGQLRKLGQQVTPTVMLPMLITQTHTLQQIARSSGGAARSTAFTLAARYAEYTGWMAQESGQDQAALWWTDRAVRLAAAGGNVELEAYSLVRQALITLYAGDAIHTVELAQRAQRHAGASLRVRGLAAQREAQGHALAGSATSCLHALDTADGLLSQAPAASAELVLGSSVIDNPVGLTTAWCLHDLGRSTEAADAFERELRTVPPTARRFLTRWRVRQALAHAMSGEIDRTCELTRRLLSDVVAVDSATVRADLVTLARTLSRWLTHGPVRELYPMLTTALHPSSGRLG